jgi:hypothetical protein
MAIVWILKKIKSACNWKSSLRAFTLSFLNVITIERYSELYTYAQFTRISIVNIKSQMKLALF